MKYEIKIEGLPVGWEPVAYRAPKRSESYFSKDGILVAPYDLENLWLVVKKKQPHRIVLEEVNKGEAYLLYFEERFYRIVDDSEAAWVELNKNHS